MLDLLFDEPARALVPIALAIIIGFVGVFLIVRFYRLAWEAPLHRRHWWVILTGVLFSIVSWSISGLFVLGLTRMDIPEVVGFDPTLLTAHLVLAPVFFIPATYFRIFPKSRFQRVAAGATLGGLLFSSGILSVASLNIPGLKDIQIQGLIAATAWSVLSMAALAGSFDSESKSLRKWVAGSISLINLIILLAMMAIALDFKHHPNAIVPKNTIPGDAFIVIVMGFAAIKALTGFMFAALSRITGDDMNRDYRTIATHDYLTGLPNRLYLQEEVGARLSAAGGELLSLVGFDLDGFKPINDLYGHATGDAVLVVLGERIRRTLRQGEFCARIGGDEFVAVKASTSQEESLEFAKRLYSEISNPICHGNGEIIMTACFGVVLERADQNTLKSLLIKMDLALYCAKNHPAEHICLYEDSMEKERRYRQSLELDLANAIKNDKLELHYQPQYDIDSGAPIGLEALIRWNDVQRGSVAPDEFIPVAENSGLIHEIGIWCITKACRDFVEFGWPVPVAVNISPQEFSMPSFADSVISILRDYGLTGEVLELELTEFSPMLRSEYVSKNMRKLRSFGVAIALDDYGAGHASLGTLKAFPFTKIKADRSFISELGTDPYAADVIRSILFLGKAMQMVVVVEGVETEQQADFLKAEGCKLAQGYWFGRPSRVDEIKYIFNEKVGQLSTGVAVQLS